MSLPDFGPHPRSLRARPACPPARAGQRPGRDLVLSAEGWGRHCNVVTPQRLTSGHEEEKGVWCTVHSIYPPQPSSSGTPPPFQPRTRFVVTVFAARTVRVSQQWEHRNFHRPVTLSPQAFFACKRVVDQMGHPSPCSFMQELRCRRWKSERSAARVWAEKKGRQRDLTDEVHAERPRGGAIPRACTQ